jgi:outer membrane receptor protein involved in Fe transport
MQFRDRSAALRRSIDVLAVTMVLVLCQHAHAQGASAPAMREESLEEVIITAQKRKERAVDVPISVSSFDDSSITARGATSLEDLQFSVPGLSIASYGVGASTFIQLRGISSSIGRPTVGRYVDEMPINIESNGTGPQVRLMDLERIEVLRGPQPTFYGDGSMGGTVRYVTAQPAMKDWSGAIRADVNQMEDGGAGWSTEGHVDIPIATDRVGLRLAGAYEDRGGWIDRVPTGQKDINALTQSALRGSFLAKLGESSDVSVMWEHNSADADNQNFGTDRKTQLTVQTFFHADNDIVSASLNMDLGFANLVEAPGYFKWKLDQTFDISHFYVPILPFFGFPPGYVTEIPLGGPSKSEMFFNELRLVSKAGGRWSWAVGVDYKDLSTDGNATTTTAPNELPFVLLSSTAQVDNTIWAAWAETSFALTDKWLVGAGVRYFHDESKTNGTIVSFGVPNVTAAEGTFTSTNPRFNLSYKVNEDWNLYVNAAKGFRSGGFNVSDPTTPTYDPESLWSYEIGSKSLLLDRRLDLEAAVWYNDWKDVQSNHYLPAGLTVTTNGGLVKGWGVDLSATVRPTADFSIGGTYGWNNLEYKEVPTTCSGVPPTCVPASDKLPGDPPDLAVQLSWSLFLDYHHALNAGSTLYGRADFQHADEGQVTIRSSQFNSISLLPSRDLLNLRLGMGFGRYDVSLYANNALDEKKPVIVGPFGVLLEDVSSTPRQYGLTLQAKF